MFQNLLKLDGNAYLFINGLPHPGWLNYFFLFFDYLIYKGIIWVLFCLGIIIFSKKKKGRIMGLAGLTLVLITNLFEGLFIKAILVRRIRPFVTFPHAVVWSIMPTTFSFPSGHSTNAFAVATFFALILKKRFLRVIFFVFAIIVAMGRVYLGAHYPLDVIVGAILGIIIGKLAFAYFKKTNWGQLVIARKGKEAIKPDIKMVKDKIIDLLDKGLSKDLCFHNKEHTLDVYRSVGIYAKLEGVSLHEKRLLLTAALLHDVGFTKQYENNEPVAAKMAKTMLPKYGYSPKDIDVIVGLILATKMPQNPQTLLQQIICDADLDHLGRDDFFKKNDRLRKEWAIVLKKKYSDEEWYSFQIKFLKGHQYFTESAQKARNEGKLKNIKRLKKLHLL